jgi:hypothetical protein
MLFRRLIFSLSLVALPLVGCGLEPTSPERGQDAAEQSTLAPSANTAELEALIRTKLNALAAITPADATAYQALFTNLMNVLTDDPDDVGTKLDALLQFLDNHAGDALEGSEAATLRDELITLLYALVGLDPNGTICILPANHSLEFCKVLDEGNPAGFVHFPQALFDQLTFVSVKSLGNANSVGSGLDEYGYTIEVRTAPISNFETLRPTVVTCVPQNLPDAVLDRLLLGHRRAADKYEGNPPFSLLPEAMDPDVVDEAAEFCGLPEGGGGAGGPSVFGLSVDSPLNRLLVSARDLLLPSELSASNSVLLATRGFSGASGSPEEFSTFKAVDRGVTGAGGSPEEFAPQASAGSPATGYQFAAGTSETTGLPFVIVQTEAGGLGVADVNVTFALSAPTSTDAEGNLLYAPASEASLCNGYPVTVATDGDGKATLPCLNFGEKAGFANLTMSFDPSQVFTDLPVTEQPCMIGAGGACDNSVTANFLIETVPAAAAQIDTYMPTTNPVISALYDYGTQSEGAAVADAPRVIVRDAYGNVVRAGTEVAWSPLLASNGAVLIPGATGVVTDATGTARVSSWTLGLGANTVIASLPALGEASPSATFTATVPTGQTVFACALGGNKTDLGLLRIPRSSNQTMRTITVYMSINGQASAMTTYPATVNVYKDDKGVPGDLVGSGGGGVTLPGNNGNPTEITFALSDPVFSNETNGSGTVWIEILVEVPSQRKIQVWHSNATFKNNDPCNSALVYAPGSTTSFKRGLSILVTN